MNRAKYFLMVGVAAAAALVAAPSLADTEYILNGDLEVLADPPPVLPTDPLFDSWTNNGGTTLAAQAIGGNNSARIAVSGSSLGNALNQIPVDLDGLLTQYDLSFEFAASDPGSATARSMQLVLRTIAGAQGGNINLRVVQGSPGLSLGTVQVFSGTAGAGGVWQTALADVVNFSTDETAGLVVNSAAIAGDYSGTTPSYTITVNGNNSADLSFFQDGAPAQGTSLKEITFQSGNIAAGAWSVVDNISLLGPDPPAELTGDFNEDGSVDGADFLMWQRGLGTTGGATLAQGDANADGNVDDVDLTIWTQQFGQTPEIVAAAVPEPASLTLIIGSIVGLVCRSRRLIP